MTAETATRTLWARRTAGATHSTSSWATHKAGTVPSAPNLHSKPTECPVYRFRTAILTKVPPSSGPTWGSSLAATSASS